MLFFGGGGSTVTWHMRRKNCEQVSDILLAANILKAEEQFLGEGGCFCFSLA